MTQTESLMTTPAPTNNAAVASTESPTGDVSNAVVTQDQPVDTEGGRACYWKRYPSVQ